MKIVITNAYTWFNKGDAGILLATIDCLKKICGPNVEFDILSFTPEEDKKRYCTDKCIKNVYSNVLNPHPYKHTKIGKFVAIIKLFFSMFYQLLMTKINIKYLIKKCDNYRVLDGADLIVVCGGGFLGGKKFDSIMHLFQIYVNTLFDKKNIMMGTSIEPVKSSFLKKITETILGKVDYIFAREIYTYNYLKEFMDDKKFTLIPDMAFMLDEIYVKDKEIEFYKKRNKKIYGLTVRNWNFPNEKNSEAKMYQYLESIKKLICEKTRNDNAIFVFVPQVIVDYGNDIDVANKIMNMLPESIKKNFIIVTADLTPIEIKSLIGNFDYFIGTRMHSNIFATSMRIPTIAIAYEKKTNGIMNMLGLDKYVIEMNDISYEKINSVLSLVEKNEKNIIENLNKKITLIKKEIIEKLEVINIRR